MTELVVGSCWMGRLGIRGLRELVRAASERSSRRRSRDRESVFAIGGLSVAATLFRTPARQSRATRFAGDSRLQLGIEFRTREEPEPSVQCARYLLQMATITTSL